MEPAPARRRRWPWITAVAVLAACAVIFLGLDVIARDFPGEGKQILELTKLVGPGGWTGMDVWSAWDRDSGAPWHLVVIHMITDVAFIAAYTALLVFALRRWFGSSRAARAIFLVWIGALLLAEAVEMVFLGLAADALHGIGPDAPFPAWLAASLGVVEPLKWVAVVGVLLCVLGGGGAAVVLRRQSPEERK